MKERFPRYLPLALAAVFTLGVGLPVADPPVKLYESTAMVVQLFAATAVVTSWVYLARSPRRRRDFVLTFGLNLLVVLVLCRALSAAVSCYTYYVTG